MHVRFLIVVGLVIQLFAAHAIALGGTCDGTPGAAPVESCCATPCCEPIEQAPEDGDPFCPCAVCPHCTMPMLIPAQRPSQRLTDGVPSFPIQSLVDIPTAPALSPERTIAMRDLYAESPPRPSVPDVQALLGRWLL